MNFEPLLGKYLEGPELLAAKVGSLGADALGFRPSYEGAWTVKEHVIHLVDSEANGFIRLKSIIAQPGSECYVMDEEGWTRNLRRKDEDLGKYLRLFSLLRSIVGDLLADESESNPGYFVRTYQSQTKRVTIADYLGLYVNHLNFHFEYIDRILKEKGSAR